MLGVGYVKGRRAVGRKGLSRSDVPILLQHDIEPGESAVLKYACHSATSRT